MLFFLLKIPEFSNKEENSALILLNLPTFNISESIFLDNSSSLYPFRVNILKYNLNKNGYFIGFFEITTHFEHNIYFCVRLNFNFVLEIS